MALSIELEDSILTAMEKGCRNAAELAKALWPARTDRERAIVAAQRCIKELVGRGQIEEARFPEGDIYIPRLTAPKPNWLIDGASMSEDSSPSANIGELPNLRREFDAEGIVAEMKQRYGVMAAVIIIPTDPSGTTEMHYVGGQSDVDNEYVGELEGIEAAVERLMDEWAWPTTEMGHQWHDPDRPRTYPFTKLTGPESDSGQS